MTSLSMRYQFSDKHFVGTDEQTHRQTEGTQVENTIFLWDLGITYGVTPRTNLTLSIPFLIATRSGVLRDFNNNRYEDTSRGIGDITLTARRWMMDIEDETQNVSLGLGIKLPTGEPNAKDVRMILNDDGEVEQQIRNVDQSIQPGDGGFGFLVDIAAFKQFGQITPYLSGTYLFNPDNTNGVETFRRRPQEAFMSVADQYLARVGVLWTPDDQPFSFGLGGRIEGVPVNDAIGGSDGFRRPGYAISIEPTIGYTHGKSTFSLSVPVALKRNRLKSVPDMETGRHGDAAFADWFLLLGWTYSF